MRSFLLPLLLFSSASLSAQELRMRSDRSGILSLGVRSGASFFNNGDARDIGQAVGGQFRMQLAPRVNTDWFFDALAAPIGNEGFRRDLHIGWSVLYYLREPMAQLPIVQPYVLAGHCFDRSQRSTGAGSRTVPWSSAVQAGMGSHINITQLFDVSPVLQYMIHLGGDHSDDQDGDISQHRNAILEGHLLFTVSMNWKFIDAW